MELAVVKLQRNMPLHPPYADWAWFVVPFRNFGQGAPACKLNRLNREANSFDFPCKPDLGCLPCPILVPANNVTGNAKLNRPIAVNLEMRFIRVPIKLLLTTNPLSKTTQKGALFKRSFAVIHDVQEPAGDANYHKKLCFSFIKSFMVQLFDP